MVEAFFQASNCPEYTKNAEQYHKKCLLELSKSQSTPKPSAHNKILKRLAAIEKKLSAPQAPPPAPSFYADSACLTMPHGVYEKLVPSRALKEVTVKVMNDPKPCQTSERLVDSINAARSTTLGKVLAAQMLQSGDILVTADSYETKNLMELEEGWTKVIAGKTKDKG